LRAAAARCAGPAEAAARPVPGTRSSGSNPRERDAGVGVQPQGERGLTEKPMFGGLAFLIHGNMAVSASSTCGLLLRIDPNQTESLVDAPHAQRFEMRGRQLDGWLRVDPEALEIDGEFRGWVSHGITYAISLAPK
jgi:TfoX N-terminal domain